MPLSLLNHSALALFAQRTRIPTSARSIGFCAIWVCISSSSSLIMIGPGPPTGPGGRPPGLFATHAQWAGGRLFRKDSRALRGGQWSQWADTSALINSHHPF